MAIGHSRMQDAACVSRRHFPPFLLAPEMALFLAIDLHRSLQEMDSHNVPADADEITYYVNRDSAGWVEQRVKRRVYIELKLECTRHRSRDHQKARDNWLCVFCKAPFPSKLRLTDHRVVGCPNGPVDSKGAKLELPVYPNLKTAKQGKDLKLALQRGDGSVWGSLQDDSIWLDLNPELKDVIYPPLGARVQVRRFLQPTVEHLTATPSPVGDVRPPQKPKPQRPPKHSTASEDPDFVVIDDEEEEVLETARSKPKKRPHAHMAEGHPVFCSHRQFNPPPKRQAPMHHSQHTGADRHSGGPARSTRQPAAEGVHPRPPPHPLRVTPIQSRSPSPDRAAILLPPILPPSPPPVPPAMPNVTPIPPTPKSTCSHDLALGLRKDRQAFYVKAASGARASVKMDTPKPALRPPIQPPGLFYLMPCGLLKFDLECGEFEAFQHEVQKWQNDPSFMDRLCAAYGRFYMPSHQV